VINRVIGGSLCRLGVEAIDLYYEHRADPQVPRAGAAAHGQGTHEGRG
jgi:aryl-alcohol dehydrogenase-like predicted oxidoreductase